MFILLNRIVNQSASERRKEAGFCTLMHDVASGF